LKSSTSLPVKSSWLRATALVWSGDGREKRNALGSEDAHEDGDRGSVESERRRLGRVVELLPPQLVLDLVTDKLERRAHELPAVLLNLSGQPLVEIEVLATASERGQVEREDERPKLEDLVEHLEVLRDVDDAGHVHLRLGVEVAEGGEEELAVDLVEAEEDKLVRGMAGKEGREEPRGELGVNRVPGFLEST
jgi:hypothetical protein